MASTTDETREEEFTRPWKTWKSPHAVEDRQGDQQDEEQDDDEKHDVARLVREVMVMIVMMVEVPAFWLGF
jgi:hypothetical protein